MVLLVSTLLMATLLLALAAVAIGSSSPLSSTETRLYAASGLTLLFMVAIIVYDGGSL